MTNNGFVPINNIAMPVDDMNFTQLFMERYRLRLHLGHVPEKVTDRLERVEERLKEFEGIWKKK